MPVIRDTETPEHDEEFWMEDGNLVLLASKVAFKVYRGLLAKQSPVFCNMFSAADAGTSNKLEGCPVVEMHDSPEDLRHLLRAIYTASYTERYSDFHQLSSLVRLGHKYQIDDVQTQALAALQRYFAPSTFDDLERPEFHKFSCEERGIELIHLSRLTDTEVMLPIAFYFCVSLGSEVVDGWRREDGSVQHLSSEDMKRCFEGYAEVALRKGPMTSRIFDVGPSPDCERPEACSTEIRDQHTAMILSPAIRLINGWSDIIRDHLRPHICKPCVNMLEERSLAERRCFWKELPTIFRL
ncbi:hypothetical protein C8T65DRAFT_705656 [Cerioporus squamosus]|nr:hypothetical protein C8T65DRAFT_705656 [Cerioporus squamosus]